MKKNNVIIETATATMETVVSHELASGMVLILSDKIVALNKNLEPAKDGTPIEEILTPVKIAAIKEEIADTEKAIADYQSIVTDTEEVFSSVVDEMVSSGNKLENVLTFLRLLAGMEQGKIMKYALPATMDLSELAENLNAIHVSGKFSATGAMTMTKEARASYKSAKEQIDNLVFERFSLTETPYTKKLSVRLNATDMQALHECYVTGVKNTFDKDGNFTGRVLTTRVKALNKKNVFSRFDGLKTVLCDIMVEKVCK